MGTQVKKQILHSEDEDSHNYVEESSEMLSEEKEESSSYEYSRKDYVLDKIWNSRIKFVVLVVILGLPKAFAYFRSKNEIVVSTAVPTLSTISAAVGLFFLSYLVLDFAIEKISLFFLKKSRGNGTFWYYTNELSSHISLMLSLIASNVLISIKGENYSFALTESLNVKLLDFVRILFALVCVLAVQRVAVKKISSKFNHNLYIHRIRKCILFALFIDMLSKIAEHAFDIIVDTTFNENNEKDFDVNNGPKGSVGNSLNFKSFIFQKKFRGRNLENLDIGAKRMLLKEFHSLMKDTTSYTESLPIILGKIKTIARKKGNRLAKGLVLEDYLRKIGDLREFFKDGEVFRYLIGQVGLDEEEKIDRHSLVKIIERGLRERYVISKNIEQLEGALRKVAFYARILTYLVFLFVFYCSTAKEITFAGGMLSTIFGTQILDRNISSSLMESIVFLLITHPYDIGDRISVKIDGIEENLVVAELNVFSTMFYRWDGSWLSVPNSTLAHTAICNVRRSGQYMESHPIQINADTDPRKLSCLKKRMTEFCRNNPEIYTDYVLVNYERIENSTRLFIKVMVQYQTNWQNYEQYLKKKSFFISELNKVLRDLKIKYDIPVQKVSIKKKHHAVSKSAKI
ncbi:hypothetical protein ENBRE01_1161 [Enteropsectra breve]|nr:hypothetical protein ENBRE01_1161 [Enteropsectra breve]